MEYLLLLQVPGSTLRHPADVRGLEQRLSVAVRGLGRVEGHDAASGEMNILILTKNPIEVVERLSALPEAQDLVPKLRAAYRKMDDEDVEILDWEGPHRVRIA